jgi:hypothetical protein
MILTDFTKSPDQIVLDLINYDNGTALAPGSITYGIPAAFTGTRNTKLRLTATGASHYSGFVDITYNRVDIGTVPGVRSKEFMLGSAVTIKDLVSAINLAYRINLTVDDYLDGPLPTFDPLSPNDTKPFTIVAAPGSLVFIGTLTLNVKRNDIPLSSVILITELNGLNYIQPIP